MFGFGEVWLNQGVGNIKLFLYAFKQRLVDTSSQIWHADIENNSKLNWYCKYKSVLEFEMYACADVYWKHRVALARFRCSNHKLSIERQRHFNIERQKRFCKFPMFNSKIFSPTTLRPTRSRARLRRHIWRRSTRGTKNLIRNFQILEFRRSRKKMNFEQKT